MNEAERNQHRDTEILSWAIRESLTKLHQDKSPALTACALFELFKDHAPPALRGVIGLHGHQIFATLTPEREALANYLRSFCDGIAQQMQDEIARQSTISRQRATKATFCAGKAVGFLKIALRGLKTNFLPCLF